LITAPPVHQIVFRL